jgi:hypothetical protein
MDRPWVLRVFLSAPTVVKQFFSSFGVFYTCTNTFVALIQTNYSLTMLPSAIAPKTRIPDSLTSQSAWNKVSFKIVNNTGNSSS